MAGVGIAGIWADMMLDRAALAELEGCEGCLYRRGEGGGWEEGAVRCWLIE